MKRKKNVTGNKTELTLHQNAAECHICREKFIKKFAKDKINKKVREHCHYIVSYRNATLSTYSLRFNMSNQIPVISHNGSNYYDYSFVIKKLAKEFEGQLECLGENTEMHKNFSVEIEKKNLKVSKDGNEYIVKLSYKIKCTDGTRFMASFLSNTVDYIAERIHKIKCKDCDCFLEFKSVNNNLINYKCLSCNKN